MQLMRHSDPKLTIKTYKDASQLALRSSIAMVQAVERIGAKMHAINS